LTEKFKDENKRRFEGEFYTPAIWADEAHKMLTESLGKNWKDEYVVWDCASGTCNLTRDYQFGELYCSTLNQCDIDTANAMGYGGTKFQYDFLNDDAADELGEKVPEGLRQAFAEGRKVLFLINPPYGTAKNGGSDDVSKAGIAKTRINLEMLNEDIGSASQQLYAQFLYKITKLKNPNTSIGVFCPPLFISGGSFLGFREMFFNNYSFQNGMIFKAGHFADVKSQWGIGFSIWESGKTENREIQFHIKDIKEESLKIENSGTKIIYSPDTESSKWIRKPVKGIETKDAPQMTSPINVRNGGGSMRGSVFDNHLGYMFNNCNNVDSNTVNVSLFSSCYARGCGVSILPSNFHRVISLFAARKLIKPNWINWQDEYMIPNENHEQYQQWVNDCHVYSLFDNASNQSSLRQVEYKDKLWDIENEFFWISKLEMMNLSNDNHYDVMYQDAKRAADRYMYTQLKDLSLSEDAKQVLDAATDLLKKSIKMRKIYSEEHPEYHLDSWDAGYAQLKWLWKEHFKDDFSEFRKIFKVFQEKMRPLVYDLGFINGEMF